MTSATRLGMLVCALALSGCQFIPGTDASFERAARQSVMDGLTDAASAQFRNERVVKITTGEASMTLVCGMVNSRNRMGGYDGYLPYSYVAETHGMGKAKFESTVMPLDLYRAGADAPSNFFPPQCDPNNRQNVDQGEMDRDNADAMAAAPAGRR